MDDIFISTGAVFTVMIPCWVVFIFVIWMMYIKYKKYLTYIRRKESHDFVEAFIRRKKRALRIDVSLSVGVFVFSLLFCLLAISFSDALILSFTFFLITLVWGILWNITGDISRPKARHWAALQDQERNKNI